MIKVGTRCISPSDRYSSIPNYFNEQEGVMIARNSDTGEMFGIVDFVNFVNKEGNAFIFEFDPSIVATEVKSELVKSRIIIQECYLLCDAGSVSDLPEIQSENGERTRLNKDYLPWFTEPCKVSRELVAPTRTRRYVWKFTREWHTDFECGLDWKPFGIVAHYKENENED